LVQHSASHHLPVGHHQCKQNIIEMIGSISSKIK
jgi:hypothetical protein